MDIASKQDALEVKSLKMEDVNVKINIIGMDNSVYYVSMGNNGTPFQKLAFVPQIQDGMVIFVRNLLLVLVAESILKT